MSIIESLNLSTSANIIISCAIMLFAGFALTRLTKLLKLPNVTAYIVVGILLGPSVINLIPKSFITGSDFLSDIALAFIAFSTGEFFKIDVLKKSGFKVVVIALFESLLVMILVFILCYFILNIDLSFSIVLSALSSATAPASTMMTIRQTGAKGDFVNTLLLVIAIDNIIALFAYSISISIAKTNMGGEVFSFWSILKTTLVNLGVMAIGFILGFILKLLTPSKRTVDNKLIIAVAMLFVFCGICAIFDESPLLGCMSMGMVYINCADDNKLFNQLAYFSPPILLLFFVRSGMNFDIASLVSATGSVGSTSLLVIGLLYFVVRIIGKYSGSYLGSLVVKKDKSVRNYIGLALIPQAGVAIGLASLGARVFKECGMDTYASSLETIILASSVLYELIGPACAKLSLYLSKSYSTNIDDLTNVSNIDKNGRVKSDVEMLIEKINEISKTLPPHEDVSEDAFDEAANEFVNYNYIRTRNNKWRK